MAINGIVTKQINNTNLINIFLDFKWERTSFVPDANTSIISWEVVLRDEAVLTSPAVQTKSVALNIGGVVTNEIFSIPSSMWNFKSYTIASGTREITHALDGTRDFNVNFSYHMDFIDVGSGTFVVSETFTLDRITKASGVTCSTVNIGTKPTITIHSQDSNYRHTLSYGFGNDDQGYITGTIATLTTAPVIDYFTWPESFYQMIPNAKSGVGTIYCLTYNNGKLVGEQTRCNFTVNVNEGSSTPVFAGGYPKIKDINNVTKALTGDESKLIRYFSTAHVEIGAEGRNYATIARQKVKNDTAYHEEYTNDLVSIAFGNVVSPVFSFELEDSRGYITKPGRDLSATGKFVEYFLPTCSVGNDKPDVHGNLTVNCSGSWFNSSFGAVNNSLTVQCRCKLEHGEWLNTEDEWHDMTVSVSGNSYTATVDLVIPDFDYLSGYVYEARATDELYTAHSREYEVKSAAIFSWSENDFEFNVPVKFNAGAEGIAGGGSSGDVGDLSAYALKTDIPSVLPNPYALTINGQTYDGTSAVTVDVEGSGGSGSGSSATNGTWIPTLSSAAISSYTVRQGWYQQVGNVVTLGFNIKATCNSGYNSTSISISGLPITPRYDASGGGMCSGAYVSADFNFECWVASTEGTITGRVQSCNNTSAANLSTSASGLFYRSSGGEITLGGTICYITN